MRPGELKLHIGSQSRTFFFSGRANYELGEDLRAKPLVYIQNADPKNFNIKALFHSLEGKAKKDKKFSILSVIKWLDEPVNDESGKELDTDDLAVLILYAHARSLTGKDAADEVARLDMMFNDDADSKDEDGEGPLVEG